MDARGGLFHSFWGYRAWRNIVFVYLFLSCCYLRRRWPVATPMPTSPRTGRRCWTMGEAAVGSGNALATNTKPAFPHGPKTAKLLPLAKPPRPGCENVSPGCSRRFWERSLERGLPLKRREAAAFVFSPSRHRSGPPIPRIPCLLLPGANDGGFLESVDG